MVLYDKQGDYRMQDLPDAPPPDEPANEPNEAIGARLRKFFDEPATEPLPAALVDLLRQLE